MDALVVWTAPEHDKLNHIDKKKYKRIKIYNNNNYLKNGSAVRYSFVTIDLISKTLYGSHQPCLFLIDALK